MSDQYVFELQFKGKADGSDYRENQFVIIDGSSMADFSRLKEDLALCMPEPFTVQYIDDEDDVVSIDTEEEFQEFSKLAKKRSQRGMLMRLILNSNLPLDHGQYMTPSGSREVDSKKPEIRLKYSAFKQKLKAELKSELLAELKAEADAQRAPAAADDGNAAAGGGGESRMETEYEEYEDSDGNMCLVYQPEKHSRKTKLAHYHKKPKKEEKLVEAKIDQRLEKLEQKKKKLMEKYNKNIAARKPAVAPDARPLTLPTIVSAIATKESSELRKHVHINKAFTHVWTIVNDGTVPLNNVKLLHTWSSPGLEPEEKTLKLASLLPGQQCTLSVRFQTTSALINNPFISYWHFYHSVQGAWLGFGHYVSVTGTTKPLKMSAHDHDCKVVQDSKKPKLEEKISPDAQAEVREEKVLNGESLSTVALKKQMEQLQASLASSEIAAEMAREAARLLAMYTEGNTAPSSSHTARKPSEGHKLNDCGLETALASRVEQLNLLDSESDTDANLESNERGFVLVNLPPQHTTDKGVTQLGSTAPQTDDTKQEAQTAATKQPEQLPLLQPHVNQPDMSQPIVNQPDISPPIVNQPTVSQPNVNQPVYPPPPPQVDNCFFTAPHPYHYRPNIYPNPQPHIICHPPPNFQTQMASQIHADCQPEPLLRRFTANQYRSTTKPPFEYPPRPIFEHRPTPNCPMPRPSFPMPTMMNPPLLSDFYPDFPNPSESGATPIDKPAETEVAVQDVNVESAANAPSEDAVAQPAEPSVPQQPPKQPEEQPPRAQPQQPKQPEEQPPRVQQQQPQVQILPQALVDGAINVAATAYSTAWNALNNLRPKEGEASEFDPVFENNMAVLVEMGFNNVERNARLLRRFNNDINQVIAVICSTGGSHNLDID